MNDQAQLDRDAIDRQKAELFDKYLAGVVGVEIGSDLEKQISPRGFRKAFAKALERRLMSDLETDLLGDERQDGLVDSCGRPNFAGFAEALRQEAKWTERLWRYPADTTGQAQSTAEALLELAKKVEVAGKSLGY